VGGVPFDTVVRWVRAAPVAIARDEQTLLGGFMVTIATVWLVVAAIVTTIVGAPMVVPARALARGRRR
jgi:hypothetical protein